MDRTVYVEKRSNMYFIENLHLFYNRPNLLSKREIDGHPIVDAIIHKNESTETLQNKEIETILERLRQFFQSFSEKPFQGGGMNLMQLKRKIREKVKKIKPR
jgi:hypothetical protein